MKEITTPEELINWLNDKVIENANETNPFQRNLIIYAIRAKKEESGGYRIEFNLFPIYPNHLNGRDKIIVAEKNEYAKTEVEID
jgi:hypothetical protein